MGVLDKLVLVYETQGADKANAELDKAESNADSAATAYEDLALKSNALKQEILSLSMEIKTASDRDKKSLNTTLLAKVNQLNAMKDEVSFSKKQSQLADSQFKILSKRQKEGDKAAGQFADKNKKLMGSFLALGAKVGLVTAPIIAFKKVIEGTLEFERYAQNMRLLGAYSGASALEIQTWGNALKSYGGDAASASAMIGMLNSQLQDMRMTGTSQLWEAARLYGLDFSGTGAQGLATYDELLEKIAKRMEAMTKQESLDFGRRLGLDAPTIMMLQGGVKGLDDAMLRAASRDVLTKKDLENAKEFTEISLEAKSNWEKLGAGFVRNVGDPISKEFLKIQNDLFDTIGLAADLFEIIKIIKDRRANESIKAGGKSLKSTKTPLSSMTTGSINNSAHTNTRGGDVLITGLTVNTRATDAEGIAQDLAPALTKWLSSVVSQNYSGAVA